MRVQCTKDNINRLLQLLSTQENSADVLTKSLIKNGRIRSARLDDYKLVLSVELETEVCYNRLFKLLIDKDMTPKELAEAAQINPAILRKMRKGEGSINTGVWSKICCALDCSIDDILEIVPFDPTQ